MKYSRNRFCVNDDIPNEVILALQSRIFMYNSDECPKEFDIYCRIMEILRSSKVSEFYAVVPILPQGTYQEILAGKTEPITDCHKVFEFTFSISCNTNSTQEKMKDILRSFPQYFKWVE